MRLCYIDELSCVRCEQDLISTYPASSHHRYLRFMSLSRLTFHSQPQSRWSVYLISKCSEMESYARVERAELVSLCKSVQAHSHCSQSLVIGMFMCLAVQRKVRKIVQLKKENPFRFHSIFLFSLMCKKQK